MNHHSRLLISRSSPGDSESTQAASSSSVNTDTCSRTEVARVSKASTSSSVGAVTSRRRATVRRRRRRPAAPGRPRPGSRRGSRRLPVLVVVLVEEVRTLTGLVDDLLGAGQQLQRGGGL